MAPRHAPAFNASAIALAIAALPLALAACQPPSLACQSDDDCYLGESCVLETCVPPYVDAGSDTDDAPEVGEPRPDAPTPVALSTSSTYNCTLLSDATVWCWGDPRALGLEPERDAEAPLPWKIEGLENVAEVVASYESLCARLNDGSVQCLGKSLGHGLGDGTLEDSALPVDVIAEGATRLSAKLAHACAVVGEDETLHCWGDNTHGQTGSQDDPTLMPARVEGVGGVTHIAAGDYHTCVLTRDAEVRCFGDNESLQLGVDGAAGGAQPLTHPFFTSAHSVVELVAGATHTCVRLSNDELRCWGDNAFGQLGHPEDALETSATPLLLQPPVALSRLASGSELTCGISAEGKVFCFGPGNGTEPREFAEVEGLENATQVAPALDHSCALTEDHTIYCWGRNDFGQLGDGSTDNTGVPDAPVVATWAR